MSDPIHVISLGAGVQSSTMALMAAKGEITPLPRYGVFADTGAEPPLVYAWLRWLEQRLPFPVLRVGGGHLQVDSLTVRTSAKTGKTYPEISLPVFVTKRNGDVGMLRRQCTEDYKIIPIQRRLRAIRAVEGVPSVTLWIGISRDEAHRMKDSRLPWIQNRWPLIDARMTRTHCLEWMKRNEYPMPPRSACVFCPYHSDAEWQRLKIEEPDSFAAAVEYERMLSSVVSTSTALDATSAYLHRSMTPLAQVDFSNDTGQLSMFGNECEGMCGV